MQSLESSKTEPLFSPAPRLSDLKSKFVSAPAFERNTVRFLLTLLFLIPCLVQSSGEVYFSWRIFTPAYCHTFHTFLLANLTALLPAAAYEPNVAVAVGPPLCHTSCPWKQWMAQSIVQTERILDRFHHVICFTSLYANVSNIRIFSPSWKAKLFICPFI